ncbi:MAG: prepilin-type N-terminal cleavage/methylation domain-containing protein [Phycisphaerae bacterium]|nr:prepilin-type N-terminal cleavage/methylation domain-containing protein [Phycisphaerae bacterium]
MCSTSVRRRPGGFTLIELLVVVSIIALLISILLPSLKKARDQAKLTLCATRLHDIGVSLMSYSHNYNRFPTQNSLGTTSTDPVDRSMREGAGFWTYAVHKELASYMGGLRANVNGERTMAHEVFYCPFAPAEKVHNSQRLSGPGTGYGLEGAEDVYLHIGYTYAGGMHEVSNDPVKKQGVWPGTSDDLKNHILKKRRFYVKTEPDSTRVLMADAVVAWKGGPGTGMWRINHGDGWDKNIPAVSAFRAPRIDGASVMYGDGHVECKKTSYFREVANVTGGTMGHQSAKGNATLIYGNDFLWW